VGKSGCNTFMPTLRLCPVVMNPSLPLFLAMMPKVAEIADCVPTNVAKRWRKSKGDSRVRTPPELLLMADSFARRCGMRHTGFRSVSRHESIRTSGCGSDGKQLHPDSPSETMRLSAPRSILLISTHLVICIVSLSHLFEMFNERLVGEKRVVQATTLWSRRIHLKHSRQTLGWKPSG